MLQRKEEEMYSGAAPFLPSTLWLGHLLEHRFWPLLTLSGVEFASVIPQQSALSSNPCRNRRAIQKDCGSVR